MFHGNQHTISEAYDVRFWARVAKAGADDCWLWQGYTDRDGYGRVRYNGKKRAAHCVAYELTRGPLPVTVEGLPTELMHTCDNPPCCNPMHLKPGNVVLNKRDSRRKGRIARGARNGNYRHGRRVQHGAAAIEIA